jgi:hypothetical protein
MRRIILNRTVRNRDRDLHFGRVQATKNNLELRSALIYERVGRTFESCRAHNSSEIPLAFGELKTRSWQTI